MDFYDRLFISIIIVIATILFVFSNFSYAVFNESDSLNLNYIKLKLDTYLTYLASIPTINNNVSGIYSYTKDLWSDVNNIKDYISSIQSYDYQTLQQIKEINEKIDKISNTCNLILDKLDNIDKNIDNMNKYLYDAFFGTVLEPMDYQVYEGLGFNMKNHKIESMPDRQIIVFPVESQYSYFFDGYNSSCIAYYSYMKSSIPVIGDFVLEPVTTMTGDIFETSITGPYSRPFVFVDTEIYGEFALRFQSTSFTDKIESNADKNTDKIKDTMTSTDYDDSSVNIDTSAADLDDSSVTGLFETLFTNFSNKISNYGGVETISIPVPFTTENLELKSNLLSSIIEGTFLSTFIRLLWYYLFGLYLFKFVNKLYNSVKSGVILGGISFNDEVISSTML